MESAQYSLISKAEVTTLPPDHNVIQALDPDQLAHFTKPLSLLVLFRLSFSPQDAVDDLHLLCGIVIIRLNTRSTKSMRRV